jgi:poly [ADP-ribose] polymerase 10/14/15
VNSTNRELSLGGGGVSAALLKKAGKDLQKACNEKKEEKRRYLSEGKVVDTRSGNLQCKRVFHIFFQKQSFVEIICACINKAVGLQFTSIAFPGIGTGMEGFPPEAAAKEMINGLQKCNAPYSLYVRIVLFEDKVYKVFKTVIKDHQSTWLQRAGRVTGRAIKHLLWGGHTEQGDEPMDVDTQADETEMELRIFGETEECVKSAEGSIYTLINKQFKTEDFEDEKISSLSQIQEKKLEREARQMQLVFRMDRNLNTIELKGSKESIAEMKVKIGEALRQVEMEASKKAQAEIMMKAVQWKRQDSNETEYAPETNLEIEGIYHKGKPSYTFHDSRSGEHFTIDFKAMEEIDHALGDRKCKIKRNTTGSEDDGLREDWEPMTDPTSGKEVPLRVVDLADTSEGYKFALAEFNKTMTQGTNYTAIVNIQRIQNPALYGQYAAKKKYLDAHNPQGVQNESWLFHGTKASSLSQINKTNFNRSFRGQNGTVYGQGCYFARDASYSNRYAQADTLPSLTLVSVSHQLAQPVSQQQKHMYLVRVLTGEFTRGAGAMIVAPPKDPSDPTVLFDSVVDNTANPSIFVVFYDADAYPEYLITYT